MQKRRRRGLGGIAWKNSDQIHGGSSSRPPVCMPTAPEDLDLRHKDTDISISLGDSEGSAEDDADSPEEEGHGAVQHTCSSCLVRNKHSHRRGDEAVAVRALGPRATKLWKEYKNPRHKNKQAQDMWFPLMKGNFGSLKLR